MNRFTSQGWLTGGFCFLAASTAMTEHPPSLQKKKIHGRGADTLACVALEKQHHLLGASPNGPLRLPPTSKYNWECDNRSFNITLLQYQRIVRKPGGDIEWEPRVPPFRLGRASELIRQINERWTDVGARPSPAPPLCHLLVASMPPQSDSSWVFFLFFFSCSHHLSASVAHTGTVEPSLLLGFHGHSHFALKHFWLGTLLPHGCARTHARTNALMMYTYAVTGRQ